MQKKAMTREEFKARWESNDEGGGITNTDIANCMIAWGISAAPYTVEMSRARYLVLREAQTVDAEQFNPDNEEVSR